MLRGEAIGRGEAVMSEIMVNVLRFEKDFLKGIKDSTTLKNIIPKLYRGRKARKAFDVAAQQAESLAKRIKYNKNIKSDITKAQQQANLLFNQLKSKSGKSIAKSKSNPVSKNKVDSIAKDIKQTKQARQTQAIAEGKSIEIVDSQGRVQILKPAKTKVIAKTKVKAAEKIAQNHFNSGKSKIMEAQKQVLNIKKITKPGLLSKIFVNTAAAVLIGLRKELKRAGTHRAAVKPPKVSTGSKTEVGVNAIISTKQKQKITQDIIDKTKQDPVLIPTTRIDTLSKQGQVTFINNIILGAVGTIGLLRPNGNIVPIKNTINSKNWKRWRARLFSLMKRRHFTYASDMYSILFGIKAKPKQRITLLKVGRVFTGAERRALV